jgi:hypothetical protein
VTVRFMDDPVGATPLGRRSRHLPASIIVHANEIQRDVRCAPIWLVERAHASARYDCVIAALARSRCPDGRARTSARDVRNHVIGPGIKKTIAAIPTAAMANAVVGGIVPP